jgi:hypothetical protein
MDDAQAFVCRGHATARRESPATDVADRLKRDAGEGEATPPLEGAGNVRGRTLHANTLSLIHANMVSGRAASCEAIAPCHPTWSEKDDPTHLSSSLLERRRPSEIPQINGCGDTHTGASRRQHASFDAAEAVQSHASSCNAASQHKTYETAIRLVPSSLDVIKKLGKGCQSLAARRTLSSHSLRVNHQAKHKLLLCPSSPPAQRLT